MTTQREEHAAQSRAWQDEFVMCGSGHWHRRGTGCDEESER